jgi:hypothetical protein
MRFSAVPGRASIALLLVLGACASARAPGTSPNASGGPKYGTHHGPGAGHMHGLRADTAPQASCPMTVPDAHVRSEDVEGGVALSFTTESGDIADLRRRVHALAEHHQRAAQGKGRHDGSMPAATASVEEIPEGARLLLEPRDPGQLDALRRRAEMHAARMERGECPMMACAAAGR